MVATTRHRKPETAPLRRPGSPAAEPAARARGSASHSQAPASASGILKSQRKSSSSNAAPVAAKKGSSSARGRPRASTAPSASDEDDNNQGIFPTKKRQVPSSVVNAGNGSDSDDAPEEVTRSAAQQFHEQTAAAMRMASQPDLAAKRAEKDRLRAVTQAAQEAASRRKAADVAALEELPQDVLNAAAAATLTLQQSLAAPRTNHIAFLPEISKKPTSRVVHGFHVSHLQNTRLSDVVTQASFAASKSASRLQQRLQRPDIARRPLGGIKRQGPNPSFGGTHCIVR